MPMDTTQDAQPQSSLANSLIGVKSLTMSNKRKRDSSDDESASPTEQSAIQAVEEVMIHQGIALDDRRIDSHPLTTENTSKASPVTRPNTDATNTQADEDLPTPPRLKYQRRESSNVKDTLPSHSPQATTPSPIIDDFTHQLGVGWTRIGSTDAETQKATRGWAKYIENHYQLQDVTILLTSKALDGASLVCARNGAHKSYFLFTEDLGQGRLVAYNWEVCLGRLASSPIVFETEETLQAAETPGLSAVRMGAARCAMLPMMEAVGSAADDFMICG